ncbi:PE family protein, partial [Flagellimonas lutimaris]
GEWAQVLDAVGAVPGAAGGDGLGLAGGLPHGEAAVAGDLGGGGVELDRLAGEGGGGESHGGGRH